MEKKIAVIGLGYVGLPLAVEFAKQYPTVGFDINGPRVDELMNGHDRTLEVEDEDLKKVIASDLIQRRIMEKVYTARQQLVILNLQTFMWSLFLPLRIRINVRYLHHLSKPQKV